MSKSVCLFITKLGGHEVFPAGRETLLLVPDGGRGESFPADDESEWPRRAWFPYTSVACSRRSWSSAMPS